MKPVNINYLGQTRLWWVVMAIGILLVISGFTYWFRPKQVMPSPLRFSAGFLSLPVLSSFAWLPGPTMLVVGAGG